MVLHERHGEWARRLRSRMDEAAIVWAETRSTADLLEAVAAVAAPVVLIVVGPDPERALRDLAALRARSSDARILALVRSNRPDVRDLAADLGADHVSSDSATPPEVAAWLGRWIRLAADRIAREGWTRRFAADPIRDPVAWLAEGGTDAGRGGLALES